MQCTSHVVSSHPPSSPPSPPYRPEGVPVPVRWRQDSHLRGPHQHREAHGRSGRRQDQRCMRGEELRSTRPRAYYLRIGPPNEHVMEERENRERDRERESFGAMLTLRSAPTQESARASSKRDPLVSRPGARGMDGGLCVCAVCCFGAFCGR